MAFLPLILRLIAAEMLAGGAASDGTLATLACSVASSEAARLALDTEAFTVMADSDYTGALRIYTEGLNSCLEPRTTWIGACTPRTLQGLNAEHLSDRHALAQEAFYGSATAWDDLIVSALLGTGLMADKSDVFRAMVGKKGVLGLATLSMLQQLELGLALARGESGQAANRTQQVVQAVQALDMSWALYYGVDGLNAPYTVSGKRDVDFPNGTQVNEVLPGMFVQARRALLSEPIDVAAVTEMSLAIHRCIAITFIRAAIKYAYKVQVSISADSYSDKYHAEGYTYWRAMSASIAAANETAADLVEASLSWTLSPATLASDMYCQAKHALEGAYPSLGLDCSMVGDFKDNDPNFCGSLCSAPAASPLPEGNANLGESGQSCAGMSSQTAEVVTFCSVGEQAVGTQCQQCRAGWFNPQEGGACTPCPPGFFAPEPGSFECAPCKVGTFAGGDFWAGNAECTLCEPGKAAESPGAPRCRECPSGRYAAGDGSSECLSCSVGRFGDATGVSACRLCPPGTFGSEAGSGGSMNESCSLCPAGKTSEVAAASCTTCPLGVSACPADQPAVYSTELGHQCGPGYTGILCEMCEANFFRFAGDCRPCGGSDSSSPVWGILVAVAALATIPFWAEVLGRCAHARTGPSSDSGGDQDMAEAKLTKCAALKELLSDIAEVLMNLKPLKAQSRSMLLISQLMSSWVSNLYLKFPIDVNTPFHSLLLGLGRALSIFNFSLSIEGITGLISCQASTSPYAAFFMRFWVQALPPFIAIIVLGLSSLIASVLRCRGHHLKTWMSLSVWIFYLTYASTVEHSLSHLPARGSNFDCSSAEMASVLAEWSLTSTGETDSSSFASSGASSNPAWMEAQAAFDFSNSELVPCRWRHDYAIFMDAQEYATWEPAFWVWGACVVGALPVLTLLAMLASRRRLAPGHEWARPHICRICGDGQMLEAVSEHMAAYEMPACLEETAIPHAGSLAVVLTPFIVDRPSEVKAVVDAVLLASGCEGAEPAEGKPHQVRLANGELTSCIAPLPEAALPELKAIARDWRPATLDPTLDVEYRNEHAAHKLKPLEPFYESFWPSMWYFELITVGRQLLITSLATLVDASAVSYSLASLLIMMTYTGILLVVLPYRFWEGNVIQLISSATFMMVIICQLLATEQPAQDQHGEDRAMDHAVLQSFLSAVIVISGTGIVLVIACTIWKALPERIRARLKCRGLTTPQGASAKPKPLQQRSFSSSSSGSKKQLEFRSASSGSTQPSELAAVNLSGELVMGVLRLSSKTVSDGGGDGGMSGGEMARASQALGLLMERADVEQGAASDEEAN